MIRRPVALCTVVSLLAAAGCAPDLPTTPAPTGEQPQPTVPAQVQPTPNPSGQAPTETPTAQDLTVTAIFPAGSFQKVRNALRTLSLVPEDDLAPDLLAGLVVSYGQQRWPAAQLTFGQPRYDEAHNLVVPMVLRGVTGTGVVSVATPDRAIQLMAAADPSHVKDVLLTVQSTAGVLLSQALDGLTPPTDAERQELQAMMERKVIAALTSTQTTAFDTDSEITGTLQRIRDAVANKQPLTTDRLKVIEYPRTSGGGGGVATPKATITSITPAFGPGNQVVLINGTNFAPGTAVTVGGVTAGVSYLDANTLSVTIPLDIGSTGAKDVTVTVPGDLPVTAAGGFTVTPYVMAYVPVAVNSMDVAANNANGRMYVTNQASDTVSVLDAATGSLVETITVGDAPIGVAVHPTLNRVYVANYNHDNLSVIDGTTDTVVATIPVGDGPYGVAVDAVNNFVYVTNEQSDNVYVIDATTNTPVAAVDVGDTPNRIAVNGTTRRIYVANIVSNNISVIDGTTNTVVATIPLTDPAADLAVNETTNRLYAALDASNQVAVFDGSTNTAIGSPIAVGNGPTGLAVNPATNRIYVANLNAGTLSTIDGASANNGGGW